MKSWTQPFCHACSVAFGLGRGTVAGDIIPVQLRDTVPPDPCLVCGTPTRIYIRVDPKLTEGLRYARERE